MIACLYFSFFLYITRYNSIVYCVPTGQFPGRWDVSERETQIAEILIGSVVNRGEVLPLLDRSGQVNLGREEMFRFYNPFSSALLCSELCLPG